VSDAAQNMFGRSSAKNPKNIVICCDGTGNEFGDNNSNVVKLYGTLIIDGERQVGYYHPGVGTMGAPTAHNKFSKAGSCVMGVLDVPGLDRRSPCRTTQGTATARLDSDGS
jgi:uncharacterized protein (DUF2235 family)